MPYAHFLVPASGGELEARLNDFLRGHRVLQVEKQFVATGVELVWRNTLRARAERSRRGAKDATFVDKDFAFWRVETYTSVVGSSRTDFLFSNPSFFSGMGSSVNLAGNFFHFNSSPTGQIADRRALSSDFRCVGQDLKESLRKARLELEEIAHQGDSPGN